MKPLHYYEEDEELFEELSEELDTNSDPAAYAWADPAEEEGGTDDDELWPQALTHEALVRFSSHVHQRNTNHKTPKKSQWR